MQDNNFSSSYPNDEYYLSLNVVKTGAIANNEDYDTVSATLIFDVDAFADKRSVTIRLAGNALFYNGLNYVSGYTDNQGSLTASFASSQAGEVTLWAEFNDGYRQYRSQNVSAYFIPE